MILRHWDLAGMLLYILMGCIGMVCLQLSKKRERRKGELPKLLSWPYFVWWLSWTVVAAGRYVNEYGVGGADAYSYAASFESIKGISTNMTIERLQHFGAAWTYMCEIISYLTTNYHVFFFIIYGFIVFSYIVFLREFVPQKTGFVSFVLTIYPFVASFNTLRTAVTVALFLLCLVFIKRKKPLWCVPLGLLSLAFHVSSAVYLMFIPFFYFFRRYNFTFKRAVFLAIVLYSAGILVRSMFSMGTMEDLEYYAHYAERSYSAGFFQNYWKIVLEQLLMVVTLLVFYKQVRASIKAHSPEDKERMDLVWKMCVFDLILIPFCYLIWMWRGFLYLYLARLILWGEIVDMGAKMMARNSKNMFRFLAFLAFTAWLVLMVSVNYSRSGILPYIFSPFSTLR